MQRHRQNSGVALEGVSGSRHDTHEVEMETRIVGDGTTAHSNSTTVAMESVIPDK